MFNSLLLSGLISFSTNTNKEIFDINKNKIECQQEVTLKNQSIAKSLCIKEVEKLSEKEYKLFYKIVYNNNGESTVELRTKGDKVKAYYYDLQEDDFLSLEEGTVIYNESNLEITLPSYSFSVQIK